MSLIKKLFKNDYIFSVFAKVFGVGIGLIVGALTARFFGAELKGVMAVVQNDVSLYSVFLGLGVYQAYPFFRKKEPDIQGEYVNNISTMFLLYEVLALAAALLLYNYGKVYLALAVTLMPVEVYIKQLNYIVLVENPRRRNASSLIISSTEIVILLIIWIVTEASEAVVLVYYTCTVLINLMLSFINLRMNPLRIRPAVRRIPAFIRFGFVPMLVYLCMTVNYKIDIQMLKLFPNVSYADIGVYSTGVALATKIWLIPDAIKDILLSRLIKGGKEEEVARVLRINLAICIICSAILALIGKPFVNLLYGEEFSDAYYVILLMLVGVIGMIFYKMIYSYNISRGRRWVNLLFLGIAAVVNAVGNAVAIPRFGIWGAAVVSITSYMLCGICFLVYFRCASGIPMWRLLIVQREDISAVKRFLCRA